MLEQVSFEVASGEFCVLLGPSGCGKSTLLRLVAGLEVPSAGTIAIGGKTMDALPPRERDIAFVFQSYALYPHMTVFENLAFSLRLRRSSQDEIREKVHKAARLLEIENLLDRKPHELSGGQRQRVAVGRAIVREPQLFLFDEPLSNLDASLRATMRVELSRLHQRIRGTILYVTHDQAEAMTLGEKIVVLHEGQIQQMGPPEEIYHRPANTFVARFVGSPQMNLIEGTIDPTGKSLRGAGFVLDLTPIPSEKWTRLAGQVVTLGIRPEDLQKAPPDKAWIQGQADIVEDLGSDRFVHVKYESLELVARLPSQHAVSRGDTLFLAVPAERLHCFREGARVA